MKKKNKTGQYLVDCLDCFAQGCEKCNGTGKILSTYGPGSDKKKKKHVQYTPRN